MYRPVQAGQAPSFQGSHCRQMHTMGKRPDRSPLRVGPLTSLQRDESRRFWGGHGTPAPKRRLFLLQFNSCQVIQRYGLAGRRPSLRNKDAPVQRSVIVREWGRIRLKLANLLPTIAISWGIPKPATIRSSSSTARQLGTIGAGFASEPHSSPGAAL